MNYKPDNTPTLTPYLVSKDVKKSLDFYQKAFGFKQRNEPMIENGEISHAELMFDDTLIMLGKEGAWGALNRSPKTQGAPAQLSLYVYVKDIDKFVDHAVKNGAEVIMPVADQFWGDRAGGLRDLDGYEWCFATWLGKPHK